MSYEVKQWICLGLFRFLLPLVQLAAAIVRFNGFSLLYGCLALLNPLMRRPTCYSMAHGSGRFLTVSLLLSTMTMLAQIIFQLFLVIAPLSGHHVSWLSNCSNTESSLRQLGLQPVADADTVNAVRIILPDVAVFAVTTAVYICCHVLLRQTNDESSNAMTTSRSLPFLDRDRKRLFKYGVIVADFVGNFAIVIMLGAVGISMPSILNVVYFVLFVVVVTLWACSVKLGRWFSVLRVVILGFAAAHLVAIHLSQFEFAQHLWQVHGNDSLLERILGLPRFVYVDCSKPWFISFNTNIVWTAYLDVSLLLFLYFILAFEIRRRIEPLMQGLPASTPVLRVHEDFGNVAAVPSRPEVARPASETQGLIHDSASRMPNYHSLDVGNNELSRTDVLELAAAETMATEQHQCAEEPKPDEGRLSGVASMLFRFVANQSYIGTLIVMMAWSVIYHSWLAFVLLISACLIWIVPNKRKLCLRCSPLIVLYAICLLIIQYVYGFDLNEDELPSAVAGYRLKEIGLVKYEHPVGPLAVQASDTVSKYYFRWNYALAVQIAFSLVFWLTLRQFTWELSSLQPVNNLEVESLEALNESGEGQRKKKESIGMRLLKKVGNWIHQMLCKYWIFACAALFLILALQKPNVYRIIYMIFFLFFVILFQLSYTLWRICIKAFWWVVILYSMFILVSIYVFQFEDILGRFENSTGLRAETIEDLGFEVFKTSDLLIQLLTPTSFLIFIILHLHYFQSTFLQISDVDRYRTGSAYNRHHNMDDDDEVFESGGTAQAFWKKLVAGYGFLTAFLWRIAEIHIHKVVMLAIFVHCTRETSALSLVFMVFIVVLMPFPSCYTAMSHMCQLYASVIIVAKMTFQLHRIPDSFAKSNCTEMRNLNTTGTGIPYPFNETIDTAKYVGFEKNNNLSDYIMDYIIIVLLMAFEAIVRVHQTQSYNKAENNRPPSGIVFDGITRIHADVDILHCGKFLANYCFFKFGREICFITSTVAMVVRLDLYSVVYGLCLGVLVLLSRRWCYRLWRGYLVVLMVLLIVQYLSCIGAPLALCWGKQVIGAPLALCWVYPWTPHSKSTENLDIFLFLPSYLSIDRPDANKLIADFFQLLFASLQLKVFTTESTCDDSDEGGGCNRCVLPSLDAGKPNPRADFITNKSSYLDYAKIAVFYFSFWITLLILFITGTSRISLFCMGYLLICFFILWFGQDLLLKPTRALLRLWSVFMMYSYLVLMTKCCLQLAGCAYLSYLPCIVRQLFGITCLQMSSYQPFEEADDNDVCQTDTDSAGLSWDAVSFTFLLVMSRIYKTWYFQHVVTDLLVDNQLSARGNEMINVRLFTRVLQRKAVEQSVVDKIKHKMEHIKMRHFRSQNLKGSVKEPTDHYVVIRSGDYYMFDDISENELEVQADISYDEPDDLKATEMQEYEQKKPGPLQIINAGITSGAKGALNLWRRQSTSSEGSLNEHDAEGKRDAVVHRVSFESDLVLLGDDNTEMVKAAQSGKDIGEPSSAESAVTVENVPVVVDGASDDDESGKVGSGIRNVSMVFWVILCSALEKLVGVLNGISFEYRYVSYRLAKEKARAKAIRRNRVVSETAAETVDAVEHPQLIISLPPTRPERITLCLDTESNGFDKDSTGNVHNQNKFEREMPIPVRLFKATYEVLLSHSELLCYFAMVLNALVTGSVCSIVYPIISFLWAMLCEPRPSKTFWIFVFTYTELVIRLALI